MYTYRLTGTHYQIGVEYGELLRTTRYLLPQSNPVKASFAQNCERVIAKHAPGLLDELTGMIEGSGYTPEKLRIAALVLDARPACSVMAISGEHTADKKPIFARNFDWFDGFRHRATLIDAQITGKYPHVGFNDVFMGRHDGMNAAGLAIGIAHVAGKGDKVGMMFPLAVRHVLDCCETVESAVAFLESVPHVRNTNFLLMDRHNTIAIVEASPRQVQTTYAEKGFAAITNQFESPEMQLKENTRHRPTDSPQRLARMKVWFMQREAAIDLASVAKFMSARAPRGVCVQTRRGKHRFGTIWSWIANPGERVIHFSDETAAYRSITF